MKHILVYGSGCKNCAITADTFTQAAADLGVEIELEKVTNLELIMKAGVMSTPAVAIDGQLCHSGSVPDYNKVMRLLESDTQK